MFRQNDALAKARKEYPGLIPLAQNGSQDLDSSGYRVRNGERSLSVQPQGEYWEVTFTRGQGDEIITDPNTTRCLVAILEGRFGPLIKKSPN